MAAALPTRLRTSDGRRVAFILVAVGAVGLLEVPSVGEWFKVVSEGAPSWASWCGGVPEEKSSRGTGPQMNRCPGSSPYYQNTFHVLSVLGLEPTTLRLSAQLPTGYRATATFLS
ncbi:hypothetical protein D4764_03G0002690 [Takifugu flavidus]|uniref:Uncharacterized protein n=1 Tax=Takifugu flavidus TaxID=433684 RepID=A0A5C6NA16_9TELE|nr:hypothetical protein D4764_03G0002690 [Takifugu flavidus]